MQHEADIRLVDPHPEGARGDEYVEVPGEEGVLGAVPVWRLHPGVVGRGGQSQLRERLGVLLGVAPGRRVHEAGLALGGCA